MQELLPGEELPVPRGRVQVRQLTAIIVWCAVFILVVALVVLLD